jgi:P4 family phage/plasmid primase-like protien
MELCDRFQLFHTSVTDGMIRLLAAELGVTPEAIEQLGVGYDYQYQAWVFAERNARGEIVGLSYRYESGKKTMAPGLKHHRGLVYPLNQEHGHGTKRYAPGRHNWVRIADAGVACPVCGKSDGCLVSAENPSDPAACICIRPQGKDKASADLGESGWLHILKKEGKTSKISSVLPSSDMPVLVVEGASDVLAAMSLGYIGIGRPAAHAGMEMLSQMPLSGREVWIVGENDAGAGREGMEKTYAAIRSMTPVVRKVMPPEGIKDLRAWYQAGLTVEALTEYVKGHAESQIVDANIFEDGQATTLARSFLDACHKMGDNYTLRSYRQEFYDWEEGRYIVMPDNVVRGELYEFLDGKNYTKETANGTAVVPIPMTRRLIGDVVDALNMPSLCPVPSNPPTWLTKTDQPNPKDLIVFKNGILDINEYMSGKIILHDLDPDLFVFNTFPYEYDPTAQSALVETYFADIFNADPEVIRLLQQWFGYSLVPDMSQEKMMLFVGRPRSGKSTTLDMLRAMLGADQCCSPKMSNLSERFGCQPMLGKLAATFGDVKSPRASEAGAALETLLAVIGQDAISVDRKRIDALTNVKLFCRITMVMNDLPAFSDHARALAPRMCIIYFPNSYVGKEDRKLKGRLEEEARSGLLINWALEGLKDLRTRSRFVEPRASLDMMDRLELMTSPVLAFVRDCCNEGSQYQATKEELYKAWSNWATEQGRQPGIREQFGRWVLNACPRVRQARRRGDGSRRDYAYMGIALTSEARKVYLT